MQITSSVVAFIALATARMAAATVNPVALSPANIAVAGLININDFQGFGLNVVNNTVVEAGEGTAVFVFPSRFSNSVNQEWAFIPQGSGFRIANGMNLSLSLSYPAAAYGGNPYGAELVVSSKFPATFALQPIGSSGVTVRIVEVTSQFALTSWKAVAGMLGAPAILAEVNASLQPQQTWTLAAAPIV
ncbi:hypothetical protein MVEN_01693000 [Mycena venus]|uniref:Uncharacterized protein n=1 Tax=Mycena venus TaxID=2733690 RepID=A0A8H7CN97_9AGAR|nr:hypothetical protein MVEN_01693000 [Mycena venus]